MPIAYRLSAHRYRLTDIAPTLTLYWVYENNFARREYYKDSKGGVHIKTIWKCLKNKISSTVEDGGYN